MLEKNIHFDEKEVIFLAFSVINGLNYFERKNLSHKNLHLKNIYCTQHQQYKIMDEEVLEPESFYEKAKKHSNLEKFTYLSPQ
jgi:hypothetical protein